ncbi:MAG: hypothetical protein LIO41_01805 [Ruminococcus sp.]|nr:hypothetical protein [Ruminococcus sp.]
MDFALSKLMELVLFDVLACEVVVVFVVLMVSALLSTIAPFETLISLFVLF